VFRQRFRALLCSISWYVDAICVVFRCFFGAICVVSRCYLCSISVVSMVFRCDVRRVSKGIAVPFL